MSDDYAAVDEVFQQRRKIRKVGRYPPPPAFSIVDFLRCFYRKIHFLVFSLVKQKNIFPRPLDLKEIHFSPPPHKFS